MKPAPTTITEGHRYKRGAARDFYGLLRHFVPRNDDKQGEHTSLRGVSRSNPDYLH
ncbi:MAG: hypothetical protein FWD66_09485 [Paludibacter sp.]|nr:hypothetical protein [Paludibacter sp.]